MSSSLPERGVLKNNSSFMLLQEKYMARNTSNNNSDAAPGPNRNINYMPAVLGRTAPVSGTRKIRGINRRHLSNTNKKKSNNIVRRRREKFLSTLRAKRSVPVQTQLQVAPIYMPPTPTYSYNNDREKEGINNYDPASRYTSELGRNLPESVLSRAEYIRQRNENEEYARQQREQELMHYYP